MEHYGWTDPDSFESWKDAEHRLIHELHRDLAEEAVDSSAALQAADEKVYNNFDRARSEAEFRFNIMSPIFAVAIVTAWAVRESWLLVAMVLALGLFMSTVLAVKGLYKVHEATDIAVAAIRAGVIKSKTMGQLERLKPKTEPKSVRKRWRWLD